MACMQALSPGLTCECTACRPWRSLGLHLHPAEPFRICNQVQQPHAEAAAPWSPGAGPAWLQTCTGMISLAEELCECTYVGAMLSCTLAYDIRLRPRAWLGRLRPCRTCYCKCSHDEGCMVAGAWYSPCAPWLPHAEDAGRHSSPEDGCCGSARHAKQEGEPDFDCEGGLHIVHLRARHHQAMRHGQLA